jgi:hypothetical protein
LDISDDLPAVQWEGNGNASSLNCGWVVRCNSFHHFS